MNDHVVRRACLPRCTRRLLISLWMATAATAAASPLIALVAPEAPPVLRLGCNHGVALDWHMGWDGGRVMTVEADCTLR